MTTQQRRQNRTPMYPNGIWVRCIRDVVDGPRANELVRIFHAEKAVTTPGYSWTQSAHDTVYRVETKTISYRVASIQSPLKPGIVPISHTLLSNTPNGPPGSDAHGRRDMVYIREPGVSWRTSSGMMSFPAGTPATIASAALSRTLREGAPHGQWHYQIQIDTAYPYVAIQHYPIAIAHHDLIYAPGTPAPEDPPLPQPRYIHSQASR